MALRNMLIVGTAIVAASASACSARSEGPEGELTQGGVAAGAVLAADALVEQGQVLFTGDGRCASCHGTVGQGTSRGPNLIDSVWIWVDKREELGQQIFSIIENGIAEPRQHPSGMPAMGAVLSDAQINALVAYVESIPAS
jgi:mono/diheme cytochrome c family protein